MRRSGFYPSLLPQALSLALLMLLDVSASVFPSSEDSCANRDTAKQLPGEQCESVVFGKCLEIL